MIYPHEVAAGLTITLILLGIAATIKKPIGPSETKKDIFINYALSLCFWFLFVMDRIPKIKNMPFSFETSLVLGVVWIAVYIFAIAPILVGIVAESFNI